MDGKSVSTVLVGLIAIVFALLIKNVLDILLAAYNFWSPIILVPLVAAVFQIKVIPRDFFIGAIAGVIGSLLWQYAFNTPWSISPMLFGILCNLASFTVSRKLHPKGYA